MLEEDKSASKNPASSETNPQALNRRSFLVRSGAAATLAAGALSAPARAFAETNANATPPGLVNKRVLRTFQSRMAIANDEAHIAVAPQTTNGDENLYPDKSGTYSKGLLQDGYGRVNLQAFTSMKKALQSGDPDDFECHFYFCHAALCRFFSQKRTAFRCS